MQLKLKRYLKSHLFIRIFLLWNLKNIKGSEFELKDHKLFQYCSIERLKDMQESYLGTQNDQLCQNFRNFLKVENIDTTNVDFCCETLKMRRIVFNRDGSWNVHDEGSITDSEVNEHPNIFTKLIFYFNQEFCTLNLTEKETKEFLIGNFFRNFVIPSEVELELDKNAIEDYKVKYTIHPAYDKNAIYARQKGYQRNIYHIIEFLRGLYIISYENKVEISVSKSLTITPNAKDAWNNEYLLAAKNLQKFKIDRLWSVGTRAGFLKAFQFIAGKIYYFNLHEKVEQKQLVLSTNLSKIFDYFDVRKQKMISEILKANFMNIKIENSTFKSNLKKLKKIYRSIFRINDAQLKRPFTNIKKDSLKYHLSILKRALKVKKLSIIFLQKIVFFKDFLWIQNSKNDDLIDNKIEEMHKKAKKILLFLKESRKNKSKKHLQGFLKKINQKMPKLENNNPELDDPKLRFGYYSYLSSISIPEEFVAAQFYKNLEKLVLKVEKGFELLDYDIKDEVNFFINLIGKEFYEKTTSYDIYELEFRDLRDLCDILMEESKISISVLFEPKQNPSSDYSLFIKNIDDKKFIVYYSPQVFDYFIIVPENLLESTYKLPGLYLKTFKNRLKVSSEKFTVENKDEFINPDDKK